MNAPNMKAILNRPSADAAPPKTFPAGTWLCTVKGLPRFDKSSKKKTDYAEFLLKPMQPQEDVDADALAEFGDFSKKEIKATYYLTDASEFMLKEFLDNCGIPDVDEDDEKLTHAQRIDLIPGAQVFVTIKHRASEDGTRMFAEVGGTAKVED